MAVSATAMPGVRTDPAAAAEGEDNLRASSDSQPSAVQAQVSVEGTAPHVAQMPPSGMPIPRVEPRFRSIENSLPSGQFFSPSKISLNINEFLSDLKSVRK